MNFKLNHLNAELEEGRLSWDKEAELAQGI